MQIPIKGTNLGRSVRKNVNAGKLQNPLNHLILVNINTKTLRKLTTNTTSTKFKPNKYKTIIQLTRIPI